MLNFGAPTHGCHGGYDHGSFRNGETSESPFPVHTENTKVPTLACDHSRFPTNTVL